MTEDSTQENMVSQRTSLFIHGHCGVAAVVKRETDDYLRCARMRLLRRRNRDGIIKVHRHFA